MNKMSIIGNLSTDPIIREVNSAAGPLKVCNFNVAVNERRNGQDRVTYFTVSAWRGLADSCMQYLSKGKKVYISGPLTARAYMGNNGQPNYSLDIQANELEFLTPTGNPAPANAMPQNRPAQPANQTAAAPQTNYDMPAPQTPGFTTVEPDELPF